MKAFLADLVHLDYQYYYALSSSSSSHQWYMKLRQEKTLSMQGLLANLEDFFTKSFGAEFGHLL